MKNFKQIAFGAMVCALAIGFSAFTNSKHVKLAGAYFYNQTTQQNWNSPSLDQNSSHYSTVGGTSGCNSSTKICTYDQVDGQFVQNSEGTYRP